MEKKSIEKSSAKKPAAKKPVKKFPAKKLPGLFKKSYKAKAFDKKIVRHLYIDSDKKLVTSLFAPDQAKQGNLRIPSEAEFTKKELKHLKQLAKQIKKQRGGRFKLVPFIAVAALLAAIGIGVTMFKNVIVKRAMVQGMQQAFGARTDIEKVDLKLLKATLTVNGIQQANKDSPMKNLFQIDKVELGFNLTELLRGKFDAKNIEVSGVALGTDRTVSGELPQAEKKAKQESAETSEFAQLVSGRAQASVQSAKDSLTAAFSQYNPKTVIDNLSSNLKSPALADEVQKKVQSELIPRWKDKPDQLQQSVQTFSANVQTVINTDWSSIKDPTQLAAALETTKKAIEEGKTLKSETQNTLSQLKVDTQQVKQLSADISKAVENDKALVQAELNKITSFSLDTGKNMISDALNSAVYTALGKYYPYVQKAVAYAKSMKNSSASAEKKNQPLKKTYKKTHRAPGRTIYYKADTVPRVLIENIAASGTGFSAQAQEISSDQDLRGKPAVASGKATIAGLLHTLSATVDARTTTTNPLIAADYGTDGLNLSTTLPVISLSSKSAVKASGTAGEDGSFSADVTCSMKNLKLTSETSFEPEFAYGIYQKALAAVTAMNVRVKTAYSPDGGLDVAVSTDADKQFAAALTKLMNSELSAIKADAQKQVTALLSEKTSGATDAISEYIDIDNLLNGEGSALDKVTQQLSKKQDEIQARIKETAASKATEAVENAAKNIPGGEAASSAANNLLKKLF